MINPRKTLKNIKPYLIDSYYTSFEYKLDSNENPYGASPAVMQAIRNFDPDMVNTYPAYGELVDKLAEMTGGESSNFVLTNGCDEAINVILNAYLDEGDVVLSCSPTFSMPKLYCDVIGAEFREIPYSKDFQFSYEDYVSHIKDDVKILYLTSPNNPTGTIIPIDDVKKLIQNYPDKLILFDSTYLNYSDCPINDLFGLVLEHENFVLLKSFSKDYALAGLRLGYIFAQNPIINEVRKVISPYSVNAVALHAGLAALSDISYFDGVKAGVIQSKKILTEGLNYFGYKAINTSANFVVCDFGKYADFNYNKLLLNSVKVKYFKGIEGLENSFRITAPKLQDVEYLLNILKPRPLFVFDLDGVVFDVKDSYRQAIKDTVKHFTGKTVEDSDVQDVKNMGNMSNDWDVAEYLIKKEGVNVPYDDIVGVFQNLFFVPDREGSKGLIDNEKLVLSEEFFKSLISVGNCAVFTGRPREEAFYSLEKFGIKKYFSYFVCNEDAEGHPKPSPFGLNKIKESCDYTSIYYFGDTVDDIKAGVDSGVEVYGVIPPNCPNVDSTSNTLMEFGAKGVINDLNSYYVLNKVCKDCVCR